MVWFNLRRCDPWDTVLHLFSPFMDRQGVFLTKYLLLKAQLQVFSGACSEERDRNTTMRLLRLLPLTGLALVLLYATAATAQSATVSARIVNRIDETQLTTLKGTVHPLANQANDRGPVADGMPLSRMHLVLKRSDSQEAALRQLITEMHTPGAANYHKWLTPESFGKQFGPIDEDVATVANWLASHGFTVTQVNPGKQTIEFSGSAGQVRSAFHTQIHKYVVNGETHFANAADPQIPAALAPVVGGFVSLNNFRAQRHSRVLGRATYDPKTDTAQPQWTIGSSSSGETFPLAPADWAIQYDVNPLYTAGVNGTGQTIAIVNDSNINVQLVNLFRTLFSLPANPPQVIVDGNDPGIDGINNPDGPNGDSIEAYLDVEWSGAVAPQATIDLVVAADTELESGLILAAEHAVYSNIAPIISLSFGNCESALGAENQSLNSLWEQAAAQGITVLVSSGDSGSAGCDSSGSEYAVSGQAVSGFASTPYNVAVGGTDFYYPAYQNLTLTALSSYWNTTASNNTAVASLKAPIAEQPWNDSQYGLDAYSVWSNEGETTIAAGSGGASNCALGTYDTAGDTVSCTGGYPKPSWQSNPAMPADGVRDLPDLSLFAADGLNYSYYPVCYQDGDCQPVSSGATVQFTGVGGTSASTPSFAGIMALVNQKYGRQGQADTVLYPLKAQVPAAFHDITVGTNSVPCESGSTNCIAVSSPIVLPTSSTTSVTEGQIGTGTTPEYNAAAGYNLATGLGSIDAAQLVNNWTNIKLAATTTTISPSPTSFAHGATITITGTVSSSGTTPTGNVALMTDSTEPVNQGQATFPLVNGAYTSTSASPALNYLPGGTYNIWVHYGGDSNNAPSDSPKTQITVSPEASGTDLNLIAAGVGRVYTTSSTPGNTVDYGTQLMLEALVAPTANNALATEESYLFAGGSTAAVFTAPTGTVTFNDGSSILNTAVLNTEGDAEFNEPFAVGSHSVTASYSGDNSYAKSTATAVNFTVVQDVPQILWSTSITDNSGDAVTGPNQQTVITFQVENTAQYNAATTSAIYPVAVAAPSGTVTVSSSASGLSGTVTLSPGVDPSTGAVEGIATFVVPANVSAGNYTVTISYSGDANYTAIKPESGTIPIVTTNNDGGLTSTVAATMTGSISPASSITISGTVTGQSGHAAPTGGIYVYTSGNDATWVNFNTPTGVVSPFSITLNSQTLFQGANFLTLQYAGDSNYNPSALVLNGNTAVTSSLADFTLVPQTVLLPVAAGSSGTDTVNLTSVGLPAFSGTVSLTCKAAAGVSCSIPSTAGLSSGGSASAVLTITAPAQTANQTYNVLITATDPTGNIVHTAGVQAVVTGSSAGSTSFALSNSGSITVNAGATTGNTSTITVTPIGGFTGSVALSCAVTAPSSTCTVAPTSVTLSGTTAQTATLTVTTASTTTPGIYTATVSGASGSISMSSAVSVNVSTPSFTASNSGTVTVTPGTSGTGTITLSPVNGFTGTISLSCLVTTSISSPNDAPSCTIPSSVTISGTTAQTATLTIYTTAATSSMAAPTPFLWPVAGGTALALLGFLAVPRRRRNWLLMLGLLALLGSVGVLGCGGGSGSNGGGGGSSNPGTTAGAYTVTVTATAGTITQTTAVPLTVN
jgi:hypothetical protein